MVAVRHRIADGKSLPLAEHAEEDDLGDRRGSSQYQRKEDVQNFAQADGKKTREIAAEQKKADYEWRCEIIAR
jgi:hypothetical protein